jgi:cell division protein FtsB
MPLPKPNRSQLAVGLAAVVALTIVGGLVWGFGQQLVRARQMRVEETRLEQIAVTEQARHDDLVAQLEYVRSDEYVERWAREDAKMSKTGEVVVVVPTGSDEEPATDAQPTPTPDPDTQPFWIDLWESIFRPSGQ